MKGHRPLAHALAATATALTLLACSDTLPTEPSVSLALVSGDNQTGAAGSALSEPIRVRLVDGSGVPTPGVAISWTVTGGGGSLSPEADTTDASGVAEAIWTLDTVPGSDSAQASAPNVEPVSFMATVLPGSVAVVTLSRDSVTVDLGRAAQLTAEASDRYGNLVEGEPINWSTGDPFIAVVNPSGEITPIAEGSTDVTALSASGPGATATVIVPSPPLRYLADLRGIEIGSSMLIRSDSTYSFTLDREVGTITPEQVMKFGPLRPSRTSFDFTQADELLAFAEASRMEVHGHTLVWHQVLPDWLTSGGYTKSELLEILREHIFTVVGRYQGRLKSWDVVNEAVDNDGVSLRNSIWLQTIGPEYIDSAFAWASQADPEARLYYNDYSGEGLSTKSNTIFDLVSGLVARGIPIHGVGFQSHFELNGLPPRQDVIDNIERLAALGLEVRFTELDVRIQGDPSEADLQSQAANFRDLLSICLGATNCVAVTMWGITDKYSWVPSTFPGWGSATILDEDFQPKPAYHAMAEELRQ